MFIGILEQVLMMLPLILGIYISYSILRITDITVDGSYVLGAAIFAKLLQVTNDPSISLLGALVGGAGAGILVGIIQRNNKIDPLVAGILATFMLYSCNLQIMGRPNISLMQLDVNVLHLSDNGQLVVLLAVAFLLVIGLSVFLYSETGLMLRAFGSNQKILHSLGKNKEVYRCLGLAMGNMLAALSGVLTTSMNKFADINMGFGVALTGIGSLVIGSHIISYVRRVKTFNPMIDMSGCLIGLGCYFLVLNVVLMLGIDPVNLKLVLGVILVLSLKGVSKMRSCHV